MCVCVLLTQRCKGTHRAGVSAALSAGLPTAALTHTGPRNTTAPSCSTMIIYRAGGDKRVREAERETERTKEKRKERERVGRRERPIE